MRVMSHLPIVRIEYNVTPFTNTGEDYFEPFSIEILRRSVKRWIYLITFFSVRVAHLKLVQSLGSQSCLDAVLQFLAKRGKPKTVISDNGNNFVDQANEMKAAFKN